ncbi:MAG: HD-GYP domain-containing protein [Gammaproteobacteria bacterium]|nr:HD-GYP domain-containing protein [Gammaproteobacteria bacterium]
MKVKIDVNDLEHGMFVSELDRPWTETPFLLQGVLIESGEDIAEFRRLCNHVYIDIERSRDVIAPKLQTLAAKVPTDDKPKSNDITLQVVEHEQETFRKELKVARKIHHRTRGYIDKLLDDVRLGNSLDTDTARELVGELADSISRSPNAMLWLTHMKKRDEYTSIHCMNVCILAITFGRTLGLDRQRLDLLGLGALLHDIGKMQVPLEILNKPGRLTDEEFDLVKSHSMNGYNLLRQKEDMPAEVLEIVRSHHERINGRGYPQGLSGDLIDQLTQITSIVDVYDAITSDRCYHDGISPHEALKNMFDWAGENFDAELVEQFIKCLGIYPIGSMVELNSGHIGIVVSASEKARLRPIILVVINRSGERYDVPRLLNLAHPQWSKKENLLEVKHIVSSHETDLDMHQIVSNEAVI